MKTTLNSTDTLASLKTRMLSAYEAGEWQEIAELDNVCRELIKRSVASATSDVMPELNEMLRFYGELVRQCEQQKDHYSSEAICLRYSRAKGDHYQQMSVVR